MQALIADASYLELTLSFAAAGAAVLMWKWRRGHAHRRIAKGLRAYTTTAQVVS
jgi:hypothetical protein